MTNKIKGIKQHTQTLMKSTLECHQSRKIRNKSDSVDLEMEDPLQSPTLTTSIAYLEERDLIPPINRSTSISERKKYLHFGFSNKSFFLSRFNPQSDIGRASP